MGDETYDTNAIITYYHAIYEYVKKSKGLKCVFANTGTTYDKAIWDAEVADNITIYENAGYPDEITMIGESQYYGSLFDQPTNTKTALIHNVERIDADIIHTMMSYYGFIYITSNTTNYWESLSIHLEMTLMALSYPESSTSNDINWTIRTSAADNYWRSVCYGNGLFVAVALTGTGNNVMTSPDGINWTIRHNDADNNWSSVCYGNGLFVAVASSGTGNRVMTSPDGINWTIRTSAADNSWYSVCYGNGLFVAVAFSGTGNRVMINTQLQLPNDKFLNKSSLTPQSIASYIQFKNAEAHNLRSIMTSGSTTSARETDYIVVFTGSSTHSYTLPATVTSYARQIIIKNRSSGAVTVNRASSDTIDGGTSFTLTLNQSITVISNGTDWVII